MVVRPAYSPDAAPSDFFLFGYLKGGMASLTANSPAAHFYEIHWIFQEISNEILMAVYDE
jgi:hypothetical protein